MQRDILIWVQSFASPWLDQLMMFFSFIGDEELCIAAVPLFFYSVHKRVGIRLAVVFDKHRQHFNRIRSNNKFVMVRAHMLGHTPRVMSTGPTAVYFKPRVRR